MLLATSCNQPARSANYCCSASAPKVVVTPSKLVAPRKPPKQQGPRSPSLADRHNVPFHGIGCSSLSRHRKTPVPETADTNSSRSFPHHNKNRPTTAPPQQCPSSSELEPVLLLLPVLLLPRVLLPRGRHRLVRLGGYVRYSRGARFDNWCGWRY